MSAFSKVVLIKFPITRVVRFYKSYGSSSPNKSRPALLTPSQNERGITAIMARILVVTETYVLRTTVVEFLVSLANIPNGCGVLILGVSVVSRNNESPVNFLPLVRKTGVSAGERTRSFA